MPDERKYYVHSDDNCRFESMTKEQILAAITQAVEGHSISDVDTGFVQVLKEQNHGAGLKFWIGSTAEYNALQSIEQDVFYILTDDTELEDIEADIESFRADLTAMGSIISDMQIKNGFVFLNEENGIPYAAYFQVPIELDYIHGSNSKYIEDFSLVTVQLSDGTKILCNVQNEIANSYLVINGNTTTDTVFAQIEGEEEERGRTAIASISIMIDRATHTITKQQSVRMTVIKTPVDGVMTVQHIFNSLTITKIVGVM